MPRKSKQTLPKHTGQTESGHTRDVNVERVGKVTIYLRGSTYFLYYRANGRTERRRVEGNLAVAKTTAAKVAAALGESRPSPLGFQRATPQELRTGFIEYVTEVQKRAWRTVDRYRTALDRFVDFCEAEQIAAIDKIEQKEIEDFVRWLRGQKRARNGASKGKKNQYRLGGIKFILSTCRTAFNWARRHRKLPPYCENPFSEFSAESLGDPDAEDEGFQLFSNEQEQAFFAACSDWQRGILVTLATYGMRVGELTHLLVDDVDFEAGELQIRSKPFLCWRVKTGRKRTLPITAEMANLLATVIGDRKAGFVFTNELYYTSRGQK